MAKRKSKKAKKEESIVTRGKRKESIARATISKGEGEVRINSARLEAIPNNLIRELISEPLSVAAEIAPKVKISVNVRGGGEMGQAQAARVAIARALVQYSKDQSLKDAMSKRDRFLLAEDSRRVEPKKYKGPKARARFQKSYR